MGIRSDKEIYRALETRLREAQKPITCVDLMDDPDFRATAIAEYGKDIRVTTNKVSDALGMMWRRNLLVRYPAPRETSSLARYAYIWGKGKDISKLTPVPPPSSSKSGVNVVEQDDRGVHQTAQDRRGHAAREEKVSLCVVMTGNPVEGFEIIGPFKQPHYASEWADEWLDDLDWWVLPLQSEETKQEEDNHGSSS